MVFVVDRGELGRENSYVVAAGASRARLESTLKEAFAEGLISRHTLVLRLDEVLRQRIIEPDHVVGDLYSRARRQGIRDRISQTIATAAGSFQSLFGEPDAEPAVLLALDWSADPHELLVGRSSKCDIVLAHPEVSRRHARLINRDKKWVVQDLASTNGTYLNGTRIGRCELRAGDELALGELRLKVD